MNPPNVGPAPPESPGTGSWGRTSAEALLALGTAAVAGVLGTVVGEISIRTRYDQLTAALRAAGWPEDPGLHRSGWSPTEEAVDFGLLVAGAALLVFVLATVVRRRWLAPAIGSLVVVIWTGVARATALDGQVPWPGSTPPVGAWESGFLRVDAGPVDVALLGPLTILVAIWATGAFAAWWAHRGAGRATTRTPAGVGLAVMVPLCGLWAMGAMAGAIALSATNPMCFVGCAPALLALLAVPVAAVASGHGGQYLTLLLLAQLVLSFDSLEYAAFALDFRPLAATALAITATLAAAAWRPLAGGLQRLLS